MDDLGEGQAQAQVQDGGTAADLGQQAVANVAADAAYWARQQIESEVSARTTALLKACELHAGAQRPEGLILATAANFAWFLLSGETERAKLQ